MNDEMFDSKYLERGESTSGNIKKESEVKKFLKQPLDRDQMAMYGTSKPKRIVTKARVANDQN